MSNEYGRVLFHVTPNFNVQSILENGLSPEYATGIIKAVWLVKTSQILWAIAHTSARHSVSVDNLYVFPVLIDASLTVRFPINGLYYTKSVVKVEYPQPATNFIPSEGDFITSESDAL